MSVVLCLLAHLRVSTAASRGRPPTGTRQYFAVHRCVVLCWAVSCFAVLGVLCCAVRTMQYCATQYYVILYSPEWCAKRRCIVLCCAVLCFVVLCCALQYYESHLWP